MTKQEGARLDAVIRLRAWVRGRTALRKDTRLDHVMDYVDSQWPEMGPPDRQYLLEYCGLKGI